MMKNEEATVNTSVELIEDGQDEILAVFYECSGCGCKDILDGFKFCPECGKSIAGIMDPEKQKEIKEKREEERKMVEEERWKRSKYGKMEKAGKMTGAGLTEEEKDKRYNRTADRERFAMQIPD